MQPVAHAADLLAASDQSFVSPFRCTVPPDRSLPGAALDFGGDVTGPDMADALAQVDDRPALLREIAPNGARVLVGHPLRHVGLAGAGWRFDEGEAVLVDGGGRQRRDGSAPRMMQCSRSRNRALIGISAVRRIEKQVGSGSIPARMSRRASCHSVGGAEDATETRRVESFWFCVMA